MRLKRVNDLTRVDFHELDHVRVHANEHVPRVLADRHAGQLHVVELPFTNLLVAGKVKDYDGAFRHDDEPLAVGRKGEVVGT